MTAFRSVTLILRRIEGIIKLTRTVNPRTAVDLRLDRYGWVLEVTTLLSHSWVRVAAEVSPRDLQGKAAEAGGTEVTVIGPTLVTKGKVRRTGLWVG